VRKSYSADFTGLSVAVVLLRGELHAATQGPGDDALTLAGDLVVADTGDWAGGTAVPSHSAVSDLGAASRPPQLPDVAGTIFGSL